MTQPKISTNEDEVLAWLTDHPQSSARQIALGIGYRDDRWIYTLLELAEYHGRVRRGRVRHSRPWLWQVPPGA